MNKTFWQILITVTFLLTACGQPTPIPVIDSATSTPSPIPTATPTRTALPTATPTASITPLPPIATFTPTFDVSTIVTVTPAPKAECPKRNTSLVFNPPTQNNQLTNYGQIVLDFLISGGTVNAIDLKNLVQQQDINGDGIPEIIVSDKDTTIIGCENGNYSKWLVMTAETDSFAPHLEYVGDMNLDNIPESIFVLKGGNGWTRYYNIWIYEWSGESLKLLTYIEDLRNINISLADVDGNGTIELLAKGNTTANPDDRIVFAPLRDEIRIYKWNGNTFAEDPIQFAKPTYRFQAIQDADRFSVQGNYDAALSFYQAAIVDSKLDWWSIEKKGQLELSGLPVLNNNNITYPATPTSLPPDNTEYPRLAAYAYYRIMLIHFAQGHESDATTAYNTLQEKFGNDPYGQPYVEMASAFWDAYQSAHKMYDGCAAAIEYAAEHPDILIPLGSDYHGSQSHQYKPEDVCPFR